jgi:hypothetical protein
VDPVIRDKGFVAHQGNRDEVEKRMWGAAVAKKQRGGTSAAAGQ